MNSPYSQAVYVSVSTQQQLKENRVVPEQATIEGITPATLEEVALDHLKPHPRNYQGHPDDEIAHLMESIKANGVYRNVVIASDGETILAGHGVVTAAHRLGLTHIPAYRVKWDADDPRALKLLVSDNTISHLADPDDRALTELLRELKESEIDLLGTGYDDMMLANLVMVTRPASEIADLEAAEHWVGMPEYDLESREGRLEIIVRFAIEDDRKEFCRLLGLDASKIPTMGTGRSIWWPKRMKDDVQAVRFTDREKDEHD